MNIFVVIDCKYRSPVLVTCSARKAQKLLKVGKRVDIWVNNQIVEVIYSRENKKFIPYVQQEKEYIGEKQRKAEERNKRRNDSK